MKTEEPSFDFLSWPGLLFFLDRTDFSEPSFCGLGFASIARDLLIAAARKKAVNPIQKDMLDKLLERKGYYER